jgi:hypothetical protein
MGVPLMKGKREASAKQIPKHFQHIQQTPGPTLGFPYLNTGLLTGIQFESGRFRKQPKFHPVSVRL